MLTKRRAAAIWTIGHSTRPIQEFLELLTQYHIETVADVRSLPGSRKYPQYDQRPFSITLAEHTIGYTWFKNLGGRRPTHAGSVNTVWRNASFRGYADYMMSAEFEKAMDELHELAACSRTVVMCAEAVWWRCHRSMIADALCAQGTQVVHIMGAKHDVLHPMTAPARIVDGHLTYRAE